MNKNFEEEYRRMTDEEIPDLWDRVEAGLSDKTPAEPTEKPAVKRFPYKTLIWPLAAAAAVLCVLIVNPPAAVRRSAAPESADTNSFAEAPKQNETAASVGRADTAKNDAFWAAPEENAGIMAENAEAAHKLDEEKLSKNDSLKASKSESANPDTDQLVQEGVGILEGQQAVKAKLRVTDVWTDGEGSTVYQAQVLSFEDHWIPGELFVAFRFAGPGESGEREPEESPKPEQTCEMLLEPLDDLYGELLFYKVQKIL